MKHRQLTLIQTLKVLPGIILLALLLVGCGSGRRDRATRTIPLGSLDVELAYMLAEASSGAGPAHYRLPASDDYPSIPQDPRNQLTRAKVGLGQLLFHETALAREPRLPEGARTFSCASCHHARAGFQAGVSQGIGEGGVGFGRRGEGRTRDPDYPRDSVDAQPLRTPAVLNVAYQENLGWLGQFGGTGLNKETKYAWMPGEPVAFNRFGFQGAETQAIAALEVHRLSVKGLVDDYPLYKELFDRAFPDVPESRRYTQRYAGLAIAAYQRTVLASQAPFQRWLRGERDAMSDIEKRGAILFFGAARCVRCHDGPALNSMGFAALGMKDLYDRPDVLLVEPDTIERLGRGGFSKRLGERYAFKVPQLYNLADSPFYGHGASFTRVRDVVEYKNRAVPQNPAVPRAALSPEFSPLGLEEADIEAITAFLERSLRDGALSRYVPQQLPSGSCFPNNDLQSRGEMDCRLARTR